VNEVSLKKFVAAVLASAVLLLSASAMMTSTEDSGTVSAAPLSVSAHLDILDPYTFRWWNNASMVKVYGRVEYEEVPKGWVELRTWVHGISAGISPETYDIQGSGSFDITVSIHLQGHRENKTTSIEVDGYFVYYLVDTEYRRYIEPFEGQISFIALQRPEPEENTTTRQAEDGVSFDPMAYGQYIIPVAAVTILVLVAAISVRLYLQNRRRRRIVEAARRARYLDLQWKGQ
jgi:hypothetical protein